MTKTNLEANELSLGEKLAKLMGWSCLSFLLAFLLNNILNIYFGLPAALDVLSGTASNLFAPGSTYLIIFVVFVYFFVLNSTTSLRDQSKTLHNLNAFLIRWFFFSILFVGIVDVALAFLRVEKLLPLFFNEALIGSFNKPIFVGIYIHTPVVLGAFFISLFSKTLGFTWLSLMIVLAELMIVITRFVFSYEQPFMADLVRYWYAGLFLFASAYTLYDEGHVRVDIAYAGLNERKQGFLNAVGCWILGISTGLTIVIIAFNGKFSIINKPLLSFEVSQTGTVGMFIKYQLAVFLGIFGITMIIQFVSYFFESCSDFKGRGKKRIVGQSVAH